MHLRREKVMRFLLLEGRLDEVVGPDEAATGGGAAVGTGHGTLLATGGAVEELVAGPARVAREALEDAGGHVGAALGGLDAHAVAKHVDLAGNVKGAELAVEGEFTPGLGDLTVDHLGVLVDGSPATADARGVGDVERLAVLELVGDQRLVDVDPAGGGSPDDDGDVLTTEVLELGDIVAVVAQPSGTVVGVGVGTEENTDGRENVSNQATLRDGEGTGRKGQVGGKGDGSETHFAGSMMI